MWSGSRQSLDCRERFLVWFFFWDFLGFWEHLHCWISQPRSCRVWSSSLRRTGSKDLTQEVPRDTQECPFGSLQTPGEVQKLLREVWDSPERNPPEAGAAPLIPSHKFQPWRDLPAAQTSPFSPRNPRQGFAQQQQQHKAGSVTWDPSQGTTRIPRSRKRLPGPSQGVFPGAGKEEFPGSSPSTEHIFVQRGVYSGQKPIK